MNELVVIVPAAICLGVYALYAYTELLLARRVIQRRWSRIVGFREKERERVRYLAAMGLDPDGNPDASNDLVIPDTTVTDDISATDEPEREKL